ncbi:TetR/AcrR family transcriptional regulator C-terminal domain-containing protein [Natronosporangium hydrolyticum]|uniref:TetR/AcrR family transcriptional regulator C-terminal domain-containing protein n=1 Tax=Natronosporangium hydrolyticum TaxID=2811111 RepID=A0A895YFR3_9ACTN|nr:TetR/AcrR family transcriptional regulator C-terminal domain-containing protein [Natronosporangium hydrolyticum]QSB16657.1 TetR/AcrR family transcriptional regulator C-terminal domain-containing protein [Natronosporangium hydrolyticum]
MAPLTTTLSRGSIVEAAVDITRTEGLAAVTMRAVATRFTVTPMALYRYVADRDELIRLTADRIGALIRPAPAASWQDQVRAWAHAQRSVLRAHPGLAAWLMDNGPAGPEAYRLLESLARAFADAGLDDAHVVRGTAQVMSWTFSRVAIEDAADARHRAGRPGRTRAFLAGLDQIDPNSHPTAARIGPALFTLPMSELFESGLDSIIASLAAADPHPGPQNPPGTASGEAPG